MLCNRGRFLAGSSIRLNECLKLLSNLNNFCLRSFSDQVKTEKKTCRIRNKIESKETTETTDDKTTEEKIRVKQKPIADFELVSNYVRNRNPSVYNKFPKTIMKCCSTAPGLYIFEDSTAKQFLDLIIDDLSKNTCFVAESHPGPGVLTKLLLEAGIPKIYLYEDVQHYHLYLQQLAEQYPDRLDLRKYNLTKLGKLLYQDNVNNEKRMLDALRGVENKEWEDKTCMQIITAIFTDTFMRQLIMNVIFLNCNMAYGRPVYYAAIKPSLWLRYTSSKHPISRSILFYLFFNYEKLGTVQRKSYIPWPKVSMGRKRAYRIPLTNDAEDLYVVKFEPKPNLFQDVIAKEDLVLFWHFLRHNLVMKRKRVIPEMEKLVPDCGFKLIMKDFDIFTEFTDLTPEQLLDMFKDLKSWPDFEASAFLASVDAVVSKMDENLIGIHGPECTTLDN